MLTPALMVQPSRRFQTPTSSLPAVKPSVPCQARWIWTIIVSCSLVLAIAIVAAVAAFAAAAFAVLPRHQNKLAALPFAFGAFSVTGALIWLAQSTMATKPTNMSSFIFRTLRAWLRHNWISLALNALTARRGAAVTDGLATPAVGEASLAPRACGDKPWMHHPVR